jgi:polyhydroxyalkanoate synthesis regulator protein
MLTLKKYANGRLFDIVKKEYVTKAQLANLIEKKEKVKVILSKTGKDVTKAVVASLPTSKKVKTKGKNKLVSKQKAIKKRVDDHKKWISKQVDKKMDALLDMMNFPNKQQVAKLNAELKKLSKKIDALQKQQAKMQKK